MTLQQRFSAFYTSLDTDSLDRLPGVYHSRVTFIDPVAVHQGILALDGYFRKLLNGCGRCDFEIRGWDFGESRGWVNWTMNFETPRLNGGEAISVDGCSVLEIRDDRISFQRDYYDMGAMVYEQVPLLGRVIRHIRGRMAA